MDVLKPSVIWRTRSMENRSASGSLSNASEQGAEMSPGGVAASEGEGRVASFFRGKDVLVTGASGFLGRVLVEKILREAPGVGTLFLLLRPKREKPPQERITAFTNVVLFDRLRSEQPDALSKLRAVAGDASLPALGLSADDAAQLTERVAVVFHVAASVRFDDPIQKAVLLNVRGTRDLCDLAVQMPRLQAFVHVSTAYSNSDRFVIEERMYPPPGDWKSHITAAETMDPHTLEILSRKLLGNFANTYVFTKSLAEHVVNDYRHKLPVGIIRPSMVVSSEEEPFPGWLDNFNGPMSLVFAGHLGLSHVFICDPDIPLNVIPVDCVVRGIVLEAVHVADNTEKECTPIHNATSNVKNLMEFHDLGDLRRAVTTMYGIRRMYVSFLFFVQALNLYKLLFIFFDLPISFMMDTISWFRGQKQSAIQIHRRIITSSQVTQYFSLHLFTFVNDKFLALNNILSSEERKNYNLSTKDIFQEPYMYMMVKNVKTYFFSKEKINPFIQAVRLEAVHFSLCGIFLFLAWRLHITTHLLWLCVKILRTLLVI